MLSTLDVRIHTIFFCTSRAISELDIQVNSTMRLKLGPETEASQPKVQLRHSEYPLSDQQASQGRSEQLRSRVASLTLDLKE